MAFSGTVSQTTFDTRKVIERAYARCRIAAQQIVGEMVGDAKEELYLMFSLWAAQQIPLWTVERVLLPLYEGVNEVPVGPGTLDVQRASLRTLTAATGTNTDSATARSTSFSNETIVSTVGIKWSATPPASITFARSDDGSTWTDILTHTVAEASGEWTWVDMPSAVETSYFRVSAATAMTYSEMFYGYDPRETVMGSWNRETWFNTPNKLATAASPLNYWFERSTSPTLHVWPTPTATSEEYQIVAQRQRYIMDVGSLTQDVEVPQRWLEPVVAGLAARLALVTPEVDPALIPLLDGKAAEALVLVQNEEYEAGPITLVPDISAYTR